MSCRWTTPQDGQHFTIVFFLCGQFYDRNLQHKIIEKGNHNYIGAYLIFTGSFAGSTASIVFNIQQDQQGLSKGLQGHVKDHPSEAGL